MSEPSFEPTDRSQVRRQPIRAAYDEASVFAILDAALLAHVAYVIDGQPFVTPTAFWREGRTLYWHGAAGSRMLNVLAAGVPASVAVSLLDGLVMAPSGFAHSLNYRSVTAFGRARLIADKEQKRAALNAFIDRLVPGRSATLRPATDIELGKTSVVAMAIEEAAAKSRRDGVKHLTEDEGWPAWAGVVPVEARIGHPSPDARLGATAMGRSTPAPFAAAEQFDLALAAAAKSTIPA